MQLYKTFMAVHLPYSPAKARNITCQRIAESASQNKENVVSELQWFDLALHQAWLQKPKEALATLVHCQVKELQKNTDALKRLIQHKAALDDLKTLRQYPDHGFRHALLQSLWIDQLFTRRGRPSEEELAWLENFPPITNTSWFVTLIHHWAAILIRADEKEALRIFVKRLDREFIHVPGMDVLVQHLSNYQINLVGRFRYYLYIFVLEVRVLLRPIKRKLGKL